MRKLPEIKHLPEDVELWYEETQDVEAFIQPQEKPMPPLIVKEIQPGLRCEGLYNTNSFNEIILGNTDNIDKISHFSHLHRFYAIIMHQKRTNDKRMIKLF